MWKKGKLAIHLDADDVTVKKALPDILATFPKQLHTLILIGEDRKQVQERNDWVDIAISLRTISAKNRFIVWEEELRRNRLKPNFPIREIASVYRLNPGEIHSICHSLMRLSGMIGEDIVISRAQVVNLIHKRSRIKNLPYVQKRDDLPPHPHGQT